MNRRFRLEQHWMSGNTWAWLNERGRQVPFLCYSTTKNYFPLPRWTNEPVTVELTDKRSICHHKVEALSKPMALRVNDAHLEACYTALWEAVRAFPDHIAYINIEWDRTK